MKTFEVQYLKKPLIIFLIAILLSILAGNIYLLTSERFSGQVWTKIIQIGLSGYVLIRIYKLSKRLSDNKPVIVFTREEIVINYESTQSRFLWKDIQDISVDKKDDESFLTITTSDEEKAISLSWLDKSPDVIKALIDEYKSNMNS
jgi:hypothetical protein